MTRVEPMGDGQDSPTAPANEATRAPVIQELERRVRIATRQGWTNRAVPVELLQGALSEILQLGDAVARAHVALGESCERLDESLAVLRDLEWIGMNDGRGVTHAMCPACSALKARGSGHNPYCGLAAALAKAEGR